MKRTGSPWRPWERFMKPQPIEIVGDTTAFREQAEAQFSDLVGRELRPPAFAPRHHYGNGNTIHHTGTIDVVLDKEGNVSQVWFRCMELPFTVSKRGNDPGYYNQIRKIAIEEITYVDLGEESSQ